MTGARTSFILAGPSAAFDPRVDAVRPDLADVSLAGRLFAPHYAEAVSCACIVDHAAICATPGGEQSSELLRSEHFALLDQSGGWAWGWSAHDHYVGYVEVSALGAAASAAPVVTATDPVAIASSFLEMPYLWGGRGGAGIDCSGLIQRALAAIGIAAPRDSDMQREALGVTLAEGATLMRGDLVFFPGHVGLMADAETLIHATRHHGKTVAEPLADVIGRVRAKHEHPLIVAKRIA